MLNASNVRKVIDRAPSLTRIGRYYYGFDFMSSCVFRLLSDDVGLDGEPRMFIDSDGTMFDARVYVQRVECVGR